MLFGILFMFLGIMFILSQFFPGPQIIKSYDGVICDIDQDSKTVVVQYEKNGEMCKAPYSFGNFGDSVFSIEFHGYIGMEVRIILDENDNIKFFNISKNQNEKRKISWKIVRFGFFMLVLGLLDCILIVFNM